MGESVTPILPPWGQLTPTPNFFLSFLPNYLINQWVLLKVEANKLSRKMIIWTKFKNQKELRKDFSALTFFISSELKIKQVISIDNCFQKVSFLFSFPLSYPLFNLLKTFVWEFKCVYLCVCLYVFLCVCIFVCLCLCVNASIKSKFLQPL